MKFEMNKRWQDVSCFVLLIAAGSLLYSGTLHFPWLFDDFPNIVFNGMVHDLYDSLRHIFRSRGVAYLSFALNYRFGGLDVTGYHIVNIAIHILTSGIVYLILRKVFRTSLFLPAAGALIFLAHPLQTQAVNYIVQRMASMCGLFFFLSIYLYILARETRQEGGSFFRIGHLWYYSASMVTCILALLTKQNAVVLPMALVMVDWYFLTWEKGDWKRRLAYILPFLFITVVISWIQIKGIASIKDAGGAQYWAKAAETAATAKLNPTNVKLIKPPEHLQMTYLVTEFSVMWLYIRLLFIPYGQVFDYGYPLVGAIFTVQNAAALLGLILLFVLAVYVRKKAPLVSFGILWFFLTLSVESTIIPLDAAVEHRLYMTMFGFALIVLDLLRRIPARRVAFSLISLAVVACAILTWQRNSLWSDPVAFARDNVCKAPSNPRNYLTLANFCADVGRWKEAEQALLTAIKLRPDDYVAYDNLGTALYQQGKPLQALYFFALATRTAPEYPNALYNTGLVLIQLGDTRSAREIVPKLKKLNAQLADQLEASLKQ